MNSGIIQASDLEVELESRWREWPYPFVLCCGKCPECAIRNHQFAMIIFNRDLLNWGSLAEYVAIDRADIHLVQPADADEFLKVAASLGVGCDFPFVQVVDQGKVSGRSNGGGVWFRGVGLSAIMNRYTALGANCHCGDIASKKLDLAKNRRQVLLWSQAKTDPVAGN